MSFHASAEDIELIDGHILKCRVATVDGDWQTSQIDLDQFIGNIDGWFAWDGAEYSRSGEDFHLDFRDNGEPWLVGTLKKRDGENREPQGLNLADKISNQDGHLVYLG